MKAGVNSGTGERVCCKLSHLEYEGSEAQRMEIILQAGLKHPNIVDLKDIVYEKPAGRQRKQICMIMELLTGGELFSEVVDEGEERRHQRCERETEREREREREERETASVLRRRPQPPAVVASSTFFPF
eukprot:COSAG03_NODE_4942_length_1382_cov_3.820093_2_plen_130_part_00